MDLILWALVAGYLIFRVWQTLGDRNGFRRPPSQKGNIVFLNQEDVHVERKTKEKKPAAEGKGAHLWLGGNIDRTERQWDGEK